MKDSVKISKEFKIHTVRAILSLVFFAIVYLVINVLAITLTVLSAYAGISLITNVPAFITIIIGVGLIGFGFLILFFLLKFIFKVHKVDRSQLLEIKKTDEPGLFNLIHEIIDQIGIRFPKKVYLSPDVNASVFYNSGFWSMILPVKKNLLIGVGLVNAVTILELKAILSHEFGHFSQKTTKVGSFVYNINHIIFNMLYENDSYDMLVQGLAGISRSFVFFVVVAMKIIQFIQWILRKMYDVVNINYRGLSRQMEFHADETAANITDSQPLIDALLRLSLAEFSFNFALDFYNLSLPKNFISENVFREQEYIMNYQARINNIPFANKFPLVTLKAINKFNKSKLIIKDQWASHPGLKDRIERLEKLNNTSQRADSVPANTLFQNIEETQIIITKKLFNQINHNNEIVINPLSDFEKKYEEELLKNSYDKIYNGYYDDRNPALLDVTDLTKEINDFYLSDLFSSEKVDLVYTALSLENDINTLLQVNDKTFKIKSFDYDGRRYKKKDINRLVDLLKVELDNKNEQLKLNDINIFRFFLKIEESKLDKPNLVDYYNDYFTFTKESDKKAKLYVELSNAIQFIQLKTPFDQIQSNFRKIVAIEYELKKAIKELLSDKDLQTEIKDETKENFERYLSKDWVYFGQTKYFDDNLRMMLKALGDYHYLISTEYFIHKKKLLNYQAGLI